MKESNFEIKINPQIDKKKKTVFFNFAIEVNGKQINQHHLTDIYNILSFVLNPEKDYAYFWNCECGEPGCANIEECKIKNGKNDEVFVLIPFPCSINDFVEKNYEYWLQNHKKVVLKTTRSFVAKKLLELSFELENLMLKFSKDYQLLNWPTNIQYNQYDWPDNLPVFIREKLEKNGYVNLLD